MTARDIETLLSALEAFQSKARPSNAMHTALMDKIGVLYTDLLVSLDNTDWLD